MKKNSAEAKKALSLYSIAAIILVVLLAVMVFFPKHAQADDPTVITYISVEICEGDTLWSLAEQYAPASLSTSDYVRSVCRINRLSSTVIISGNYLVLPVYSVPEC